MWRYHQRTGLLEHVDRDGKVDRLGRGYSGHGDGVNNPALQHVREVGPIPRGLWTIGPPYDSQRVGPKTLPLIPDPGTDTLGRSAFLIHGDNHHRDQSASRGCIVLARVLRDAIHDSDDDELEVVEG